MKGKRKLSAKTMVWLCQQLSFALGSGLSLVASLELLARETGKGTCQTFILQWTTAVEQGVSVNQGLQQTEFWIAPMLSEFILLGERRGDLAVAMEQAADYFSQQNRLRSLLWNAFLYPAVVFVMMLAALALMIVFVVPAIIQTYANFSAPLPILTQWVIGSSLFLQQKGLYLFSITAGLVLLGVFYWPLVKGKPEVRAWRKKILLRLPGCSGILRQYFFIQFSQALGLLLRSELLLVNSLGNLTEIFQDTLFAEELRQLHRETEAGVALAQGLGQCSFIPVMAQQMLVVGERSGSLGPMLLRLHGYYQERFQQYLLRLVKLLEPLMIVALGLFVLLMAGSLFLPIINSYRYLL